MSSHTQAEKIPKHKQTSKQINKEAAKLRSL